MIRRDSLGPLRVVIRTVLARSPDLLKTEHALRQSLGAPPMTGHSYVASEVAYHMLGGPEGPWMSYVVRHEGRDHWYLWNPFEGTYLDLTADQFDEPVPYLKGLSRKFATREPGERAQEAIRRIAGTDAGELVPQDPPPPPMAA